MLTVGNGSTCSVVPFGALSAVIPLYIKDNPSTLLGADRPAGFKLQAFSLQLIPGPASSVALDIGNKLRIYGSQAGITEALSADFSSNPRTSSAAGYVLQFHEADPLPFDQGTPAPGNLVGNLTVHLAAGLPSGSRIDLIVNSEETVTVFSNFAGTQKETRTATTLSIVNGCIEVGSGTGGAIPQSRMRAEPLESVALVDAAVAERIASEGAADVFIELADTHYPGADDVEKRSGIARAQSVILAAVDAKDFKLRHRFSSVHAMAGRLSARGLVRIRSSRWVKAVTLDGNVRPATCETRLDTKVNLVGENSVENLSGAGVTVAVIDTGIEVDNVFLRPAIKAEGCTNPIDCPQSLCRPSWLACPVSSGHPNFGFCQLPVCSTDIASSGVLGHGTLVASVIASQALSPGECPATTTQTTQHPVYFPPAVRGLAPGINLVPIRIFTRDPVATTVSDLTRALELIRDNVLSLNVKVVNMSLTIDGDTLYASSCDQEPGKAPLSDVIRGLRNDGVALFAASGNHGSSTSIAAPACISDVFPVGGTYDKPYGGPQPRDDPRTTGVEENIWRRHGLRTDCSDSMQQITGTTIPCFSNSNSRVKLVAPAAWITTAAAAGYRRTDNMVSPPQSEDLWTERAGTSFASPAAAANAALLLQTANSVYITPEEAAAIMTDLAKNHGATTITDGRNNVVVTKTDANASIAASRSQDRNSQRADANRDGAITTGDVFYLINFLFAAGPRPETPWRGDANCDGLTTAADVFFLINDLFADGPSPSCPVFR